MGEGLVGIITSAVHRQSFLCLLSLLTAFYTIRSIHYYTRQAIVKEKSCYPPSQQSLHQLPSPLQAFSSRTDTQNIKMTRSASVIEPHPTVPKSGGYIGGGRGGAGNIKKYRAEELSNGASATGPASRISLARPFGKRTITSGRGGAGNVFSSNEESIFQFDEEMIKSRETAHVTPVYHIGRGGAGNWINEAKPVTASQRKNSTDSERSNEESAGRPSLQRFSSIFSRRSS